MADPLIPVVPLRLRHGQGETLSSRGFADQAAQDDQLRWWHNRAVHTAYGVVQGLAVDLISAPGFAIVAPGLAYDRQGRELILRAERRLPVPAGPEKYRLVIGYRAVGGPDGPVVLAWLPSARPVGKTGVPLKLSDDSVFVPPRTRPIAAPRIGRGTAILQSAGTEIWVETTGLGALVLGLQRQVDTSAAGFTDTPCYFIQLNGPLVFPGDPGLPLPRFHHVATPTKDGFLYRLILPGSLGVRFRSRATLTRRAVVKDTTERVSATDLVLTWTGIQMQAPPPTLLNEQDR